MTNRHFSLTRGPLVILCCLAICGMAAAEETAPFSRGTEKSPSAAKAVFSPELQALLDDILKKDEWKTADVMELVPRLQSFRTELAEFQHLPNLEALKDKFPDDVHTAHVVDLYCRYAVHKSYQAVAKDIEAIHAWDNDARLVLLAVECAHHLDRRNLARQLELGRRLVELEPGNKKFRQSLAGVEKQLAKLGTDVQPPQQTVSVASTQPMPVKSYKRSGTGADYPSHINR